MSPSDTMKPRVTGLTSQKSSPQTNITTTTAAKESTKGEHIVATSAFTIADAKMTGKGPIVNSERRQQEHKA